MRSGVLLGGLALLSIAFGGAVARASDAIGVRTMTITPPERGASVGLTLWYPAGSGGRPERFGANPVFAGVSALRDAAMAEGVFPVVLIAHGGLRSAPHQSAWIGSRLAERGYIVAAIQPPPLTATDATRGVAEIGLRPRDLSAALTAVESDPSLRPYADLDKVAALGFFLGGTSALAVGGARLDPERFRRLCDTPVGGPDCAWFTRAGVDLRKVDTAPLARDHRDPRVRTVVAVDPEISAAYSLDGLAETAVTTTIINLGARGETPAWLESAYMGAITPVARYIRVPGVASFSSFGLCTPRAGLILRTEGEDEAICQDSGGQRREDIHNRLAAMIAAALLRGFSTTP
ncbi:alpha/beta hydrolase family protein [Azospirillum griseum]|uniref:Dienelactone hydrolase n=1 Tax=Azospirillum griseum TaxID=2496639 RepID=A0A3S0JE55_9PROT|nr:hypothetical protein [Azospirillum griseum]RTR13474.1 hypothetical protein EJ903_24525 [Azospirillum griseum]